MTYQIEDSFNGWNGNTSIRLTNGQVWKQYAYHYEYRYAYRPYVKIEGSDGYGAYSDLTVDGCSPVRCCRIE